VSRLFAPDPDVSRRWCAIAGGVALWIGAWTVLMLRLPLARRVFFAEDGLIFWLQASQGCPRLTEPSNGYMHAVPRMLGCVAQAFPLGWAPTVMAAGSAAIAAALAVLIFHIARAHLPSSVPRLAMVAVLVLLPVAGAEGVDNAANLQWYFLCAAFWLLLWRPRWPGAITGVVVTALACTTSVLSLFLAPLALLRLVCSHGWRDRLIPLAFAAGALVQVLVMSGTSRSMPAARPTAEQLVAGYLVRIVTAGLLGPAQATSLTAQGTLWITAGVTAVVAVSVTAGLCSARLRPLTLAALLGSIWLYVAGAWIQWKVSDWGYTRGLDLQTGGRYHIAPMFLLWVAVISGLAAGAAWRPASWRRAVPLGVATALVATAFTVGAVSQFRDGERSRLGVTAWRTALDVGRTACGAGAVVVNLSIAPPGWHDLPVPCGVLRR
jgi:hypothetical protein